MEDEAVFLRERVRAWKLVPTRLELAACLGHEGAQLAIGFQREEPDLGKWTAGLDHFGRDIVVPAAHAAASSRVHLWNERPDSSVQHLGAAPPGEHLGAVARWLACRSRSLTKTARSLRPAAHGGGRALP